MQLQVFNTRIISLYSKTVRYEFKRINSSKLHIFKNYLGVAETFQQNNSVAWRNFETKARIKMDFCHWISGILKVAWNNLFVGDMILSLRNAFKLML